MSEKTVYRLSDVLANRRGEKAARLALIHFIEMTDEEQRSELKAIRSLKGVKADDIGNALSFLEGVIALEPEARKILASQMRKDYREDLLSGRVGGNTWPWRL